MKVKLIQIGKTEDNFVADGVKIYQDRLKHYIRTEEITLKPKKNLSSGQQNREQQVKLEGGLILDNICSTDFLILLDEKGRQLSSVNFAKELEVMNVNSVRTLVFCIGGAYGFSKSVYERANDQISFSKFTFPHQLIRLMFWEQMYRWQTIIKGEKYHH
ncbi:MAG: 23S rRNA (pseudouridine(1915)-N(3))-methyltransferase RlmH [Bacteroidota bacterium]|jgi:23S rRNA (pseudouridine1915-N3)-methyltransferase